MNRVFFLCSILALLITACSDDSGMQNAEDMRTLPVVLSFSADVMSTPDQGQQTRAIGDPGEGDLFELPEYVYLYVFGYGTTDKTGDPHLMQPTVGNPVKLSKNISDWSVNANGNIYTYNHSIDILVGDANNFKSGDAFVVASVERIEGIEPTGADDAARLADLKAKTFDIPSDCFTSSERSDGTSPDAATALDKRNRFLKNLYSSPTNLYYEWKNNSYTVENGEYKIITDRSGDAQYYGTVLDAGSKIPHVSMVLYHVAARLDVMWDVQKDADGHEQMDKRVTGIKVTNLKSRGCKLFSPTENAVVTDATYSTAGGYTESFLPYESTNASMYWQGREVRYVIQQGDNNVPFNGTIQLNGSSERSLNATIHINTPYNSIFTSWMRGYIKL